MEMTKEKGHYKLELFFVKEKLVSDELIYAK